MSLWRLIDYVKSVLNINNTSQQEKPINYINPYDEMIKDAEKMNKQCINQNEYDIDYEFDVNSVDDVKDEILKNEIESLYKSVDEYTQERMKLDNQFNVYNSQNKKGYSSLDIFYFAINTKLNALVMIGRCSNLSQTKNEPINLNKILPAFVFILIISAKQIDCLC